MEIKLKSQIDKWEYDMDEFDIDFSDVKAQLKELSEKLNTLVQESLYTNALLKAVLQGQNITRYKLPDTYDSLSDKSFIIIHECLSSVSSFIKTIAETNNRGLHSILNENTGDFVSTLMDCNDNDYILIPNTVLIKNPQLVDYIISIYNTGKADLFLGRGPASRQITLEFPKLNFIICSDFVELLSPDLRKTFFVAN